ncbi:hypothetical protein ABZ413_06230 [Nocardia rhamnosiphila]
MKLGRPARWLEALIPLATHRAAHRVAEGNADGRPTALCKSDASLAGGSR